MSVCENGLHPGQNRIKRMSAWRQLSVIFFEHFFGGIPISQHTEDQMHRDSSSFMYNALYHVKNSNLHGYK